jgi:hypothetical protein
VTTEYDELPKPAREYLAFVEKEAGAKVGMISTGPDRNHTIFMDEFVTELKTAAIPQSLESLPRSYLRRKERNDGGVGGYLDGESWARGRSCRIV